METDTVVENKVTVEKPKRKQSEKQIKWKKMLVPLEPKISNKMRIT